MMLAGCEYEYRARRMIGDVIMRKMGGGVGVMLEDGSSRKLVYLI